MGYPQDILVDMVVGTKEVMEMDNFEQEISKVVKAKNPLIVKYVANQENWRKCRDRKWEGWLEYCPNETKPYKIYTLHYVSVCATIDDVHKICTNLNGSRISKKLPANTLLPVLVRSKNNYATSWVLPLPPNCYMTLKTATGTVQVHNNAYLMLQHTSRGSDTFDFDTLTVITPTFFYERYLIVDDKGGKPDKGTEQLEIKNIRAYKSGDGVYSGINVDYVTKDGDLVPIAVAEVSDKGQLSVRAYGDPSKDEPTYVKTLGHVKDIE